MSVSKIMDKPTEPDSAPASLPAALPPFEPSLPIHANPAGEKRLVRDIGAYLRQIAGLKPGSSSIRTPAMVAEIIERLRSGETLLSVTMDPMMPSHSTLHDWMDNDPELDDAVQRARAIGAHILFDAKNDVAMGGALSTGDRLRDELVVKVFDQAAAKRNRAAFGNEVTINANHSIPTVVLPTIALPSIAEAEFNEVDGDDSEE